MNIKSQQLRKYTGIGSLVLIIALNIVNSHPQLLSPLPSKNQVWDKVRSQLMQKDNHYALKKEFSIVPQALAASPANDSSAYVVVDFESGKVLAEKNMSKRMPIASLTKMMTAITALDLASPDDTFTASDYAANEIPTKIGVQPGEKFTLRELLHAILLTSANDAADVIKEGVDTKYNSEVFIKAMNEKAKFLKLKNSHFANPQGFDNAGNYSTAEDLAIISNYALKHYPVIAEIVKKDYFVLPANENHRTYNLPNWLGLMDVYPDVTGLKIGNTAAAGTTIAVVSERGGKKILAVLLGAPDILKRDMWTADLLDIGYELSSGLDPVAITETDLRHKYASWSS